MYNMKELCLLNLSIKIKRKTVMIRRRLKINFVVIFALYLPILFVSLNILSAHAGVDKNEIKLSILREPLSKIEKYVAEKNLIQYKDDYGMTVLHYALMYCREDVADYLLRNYFDLDTTINGQSLIHFTVMQMNLKMTDYLLQKGVDVNLKDTRGMTPLHYAASNDDIEITNLLLKFGANISEKDNCGIPPRGIALKNQSLHVALFLKEMAYKGNAYNTSLYLPENIVANVVGTCIFAVDIGFNLNAEKINGIEIDNKECEDYLSKLRDIVVNLILSDYAKRHDLKVTENELKKLGDRYRNESETNGLLKNQFFSEKQAACLEKVRENENRLNNKILSRTIEELKIFNKLYKEYGGAVQKTKFGAVPLEAIRELLDVYMEKGYLKIHIKYLEEKLFELYKVNELDEKQKNGIKPNYFQEQLDFLLSN